MKNIRFAIVGYGWIGKRHAAMIGENPLSTLVAVCDIRPKGQTDFTLDIPYYSNYSDLLSNESFDVLCVCTPNGLHAQMAYDALIHNHHVVVEKPFALSLDDAKIVKDEAQKRNLYLFPVAQNRFSPPIVWLKDMLVNQRLGKIFMVQVNCYWNRDSRYYVGNWHGTNDMDGGVLFTQFWHHIDVMCWLFGAPEVKNVILSNFNHKNLAQLPEDSGAVQFIFNDSGALGTLNFSTSLWQSNFESAITIIGERGTVKIGGQYMNEVLCCNVENYEMPTLAPCSQSNDYGGYKGSASNHHFVIQNVVETLNNQASPNSSVDDAILTLTTIENIYGSARKTPHRGLFLHDVKDQ